MIDIFSILQSIYIYIKYKGKVVRFIFPPSSIQMYTIEKTLQRFGVIVYGRRVHSGGYKSFIVTEKQVRWAEQLCFRAKFPKLGVDYKENEKYKSPKYTLPEKQWEPKGRKGDIFLAFGNLLAGLFKTEG